MLRRNLLPLRSPEENFIVTQDPDETHKIPTGSVLGLWQIFSTRNRSEPQPLKISSLPFSQSSFISDPKSRLIAWTTTAIPLGLLTLHEHSEPRGEELG